GYLLHKFQACSILLRRYPFQWFDRRARASASLKFHGHEPSCIRRSPAPPIASRRLINHFAGELSAAAPFEAYAPSRSIAGISPRVRLVAHSERMAAEASRARCDNLWRLLFRRAD